MRHRAGFHNISEEEIKRNEKYFKIRETIKPEELAMLFKEKIQTRLQKYNKVLEEIGKLEAEGFFLHLKTELDKNKLKDVVIKFWSSIAPEFKKEVEDLFNGKNPNVQLIIHNEGERLVADHSKLIIQGGGIPVDEDFLEQIKTSDPNLYNQIIEINKDKIITTINLSLTGSLNDIYNLVHEITHYFSFNDTATERIYSEVAPQCMERILDDFLLQLTDEELKQYNFTKEDLREDIRKRRIISFTSRYNATKKFIEKNDKKEAEKEELLKYFLAQLFQAQFRKYGENEKSKKLLEFIKYVKNDNFEMATKTLGINWSNGLKRQIYINNIIEDVQPDFRKKPKDRIVKEEQREEIDRLV